MSLCVNRIQSPFSDTSFNWIIFEDGCYSHPMIIINDYEMDRFIKEVESIRNSPVVDVED